MIQNRIMDIVFVHWCVINWNVHLYASWKHYLIEVYDVWLYASADIYV